MYPAYTNNRKISRAALLAEVRLFIKAPMAAHFLHDKAIDPAVEKRIEIF
ncbi:MAG: hypothetical protein JWR09_896 [Mucilaginibacter sp.]|nr:hypothetical protein [Mucilaginibacter sp.]